MQAYNNPFGWPTPITDAMIGDSLLPPFTDPAESIAERLVMLGHLAFDVSRWGGSSGRLGSYWVAFGNRIESSTNQVQVSTWWETFMEDINGVPLRDLDMLHEKNLLIRPATLPGIAVDEDDVLTVLRTHPLELRDRTRRWAKERRDLRVAEASTAEEED